MSTKKDEKKAAKADKNEKNSKFALKLSLNSEEKEVSAKRKRQLTLEFLKRF